MDEDVLLSVSELRTYFYARDDTLSRAVDGVSLTVRAGRTVCVVGESGSGKSVTARSILGLVDPPGKIVSGEILWRARNDQLPATERSRKVRRAEESGEFIDLAALDPRGERMRRIRGEDISMIFQEPMSSLSPMYTVGAHLVEVIRLHRKVSKKEAWSRGLEMLRKVGIPRADERMRAYPFQLSGGMCQRVMIALALVCEPRLLIADEPTTALDVTTQARILDLIAGLKAKRGMSILFITHDLGVVAEIADDVVVVKDGQVVEHGPVDDIFHRPQHAYTRHLLSAIPTMSRYANRQEGRTDQDVGDMQESAKDQEARDVGIEELDQGVGGNDQTAASA